MAGGLSETLWKCDRQCVWGPAEWIRTCQSGPAYRSLDAVIRSWEVIYLFVHVLVQATEYWWSVNWPTCPVSTLHPLSFSLLLLLLFCTFLWRNIFYVLFARVIHLCKERKSSERTTTGAAVQGTHVLHVKVVAVACKTVAWFTLSLSLPFLLLNNIVYFVFWILDFYYP